MRILTLVIDFIGSRDGLVDGLLEREFPHLGLFYFCLLCDQGAEPDDSEILHQSTPNLLESVMRTKGSEVSHSSFGEAVSVKSD